MTATGWQFLFIALGVILLAVDGVTTPPRFSLLSLGLACLAAGALLVPASQVL